MAASFEIVFCECHQPKMDALGVVVVLQLAVAAQRARQEDPSLEVWPAWRYFHFAAVKVVLKILM